MKVICAPDSFKESLTADDAARAMARGIRRVQPDAIVDLCPIADGGEGTVDALLAATNGRRHVTRVTGPRFDPLEAHWGMLGHRPTDTPSPAPAPGPAKLLTAVIEMAAASGLEKLPPHRRDPTRTTTYGTGELMHAALDAGAQRIIMGIGGSATTDGGCGMAAALGVRFLDAHDRQIDTPTGGTLGAIHRIDPSRLDPRITRTQIVVACDVTNPLTGPNGAAHVYGPQKGATPEQVEQLDQGLRHLAQLWREQLGRDVEQLPGAGAAGGLGGGLLVFTAAQLRPGIELVLEAVAFDQRVRGAQLCLTGEGRIDGQSLAGKAVLGVARAAARHGVPTIALVGSAGDDADRTLAAGLTAYHVIGPNLTKEQSIRRTAELLETAAAKVAAQYHDPNGN